MATATIVNDGDNDNGKKAVKLFEGDGFFFDRLLLRENSIGNSSRIYSRSRSNTTEGVPFQWERAPGTPKHELQDEAIPPLIPPPAAQSKGLPPRPKRCSIEHSKESSNKWKPWFWKKNKKKRDCNANAIHRSVSCDDKFQMEFMDSIPDSMGSSASSSSSSSCNRDSLHSQMQVGLPRNSLDSRTFCMSPWNITAIWVRAARRA